MKQHELPSLTEEILEEESKYVRLWSGNQGMHYDIIRRNENSYDQIQFVNSKDGMKIVVKINEGNAMPVSRPYERSEAEKFMQVAVYAFPEEALTMQLCQFVKSEAEELHKAASRSIYKLKFPHKATT